MKKIFAVTLLSMIILFAGCNGSSADDNKILPTFNSKTISGNSVSNEIFAAKKITVVNIWGTFCPPCIAEMPDLGDMARTLPANAQIVGIVCDAEENSPQIKKAQEIVRKANADFVNIVPDKNLQKFLENIDAVPTTIFVNSNGKIVGKAIIGADVQGYKDELAKLLKN